MIDLQCSLRDCAREAAPCADDGWMMCRWLNVVHPAKLLDVMKTIILQEPGKFRLDESAAAPGASELAAGEALVRVRRVGICGTDLHAFRGRQPFFTYPRILGHELGVEVVAIDPASSKEFDIRA